MGTVETRGTGTRTAARGTEILAMENAVIRTAENAAARITGSAETKTTMETAETRGTGTRTAARVAETTGEAREMGTLVEEIVVTRTTMGTAETRGTVIRMVARVPEEMTGEARVTEVKEMETLAAETVAVRTTMEIAEIMAAGAASAYLSVLKSPRVVLTVLNRSRKTLVREVTRK